ncbi:MAG: hypothetical protein ACRBCT_07270 [Alphaproteobacteria bacterium]
MSLALISYVWTAAMRDRLIIAMLVMLALGASVSVFLASAALTEKDQFAAVLSAGGIRIVGILGLVVFTVFFIRRSIESKDIELLLSRPFSRIQFVASYAIAFSMLATTIALACAACLFATAPHLFGLGHVIWTATLILEYIIVVNIAFFFALMLSSAAVSVMAVVAFYVLSRMMGQFLGIIKAGIAGEKSGWLENIMNIISMLTPRLDLLSQTTWLIYPIQNASELAFVALQCLLILVIIFIAALIDLLKRQF